MLCAKAKKKIAIIGSVGLPANYGGFETLVEHLTKELHGQYDFTVFCSKRTYPIRTNEHNGARLRYLPFDANGYQSIFYDALGMILSARHADVLLILGVSGCLCLPFVRFFIRGKTIINIDGLEWKRKKWGIFARMLLRVSESFAVRYGDLIISDNREIDKYIKEQYRRPSKLIPYGGNHVCEAPRASIDRESFEFIESWYAFKVCRIEPENNVELVLEAFKSLPDFPLVVVGNWARSGFGKMLLRKYSNHSHLWLLDPIYDTNKLDMLRSQASVYIHGHSAGGTNPSLVEAMYLGLPIIAYDVNYNRSTTHGSAVYFSNSRELQSEIRNLDEKKRKTLGWKMKMIAAEHYTWDQVADAYAKAFESSAILVDCNISGQEL